MPTIRDIADAAEVSRSTVSQVLNGNAGYCSPATRDRVLAVAHRLGYYPSASARALACGRTHIVAIGCGSIDDMVAANQMSAAQRLLHQYGYHLLLTHAAQDADQLERYLRERRVDVVLWGGPDILRVERIAAAAASPHQIVTAAGPVFLEHGRPRVPRGVVSAWWLGEVGDRQLLDHIQQLGHRRVAYLYGELPRDQAPDHPVELLAAARGIEMIRIACESERDRLEAGVQMGNSVLSIDPLPTAVVGRNDDFAIGALHALHEAGVAVPEDVSVMGFFGTPASKYTYPSLSTVYVPYRECAEHVLNVACRHLASGHSNGPEPQNTAFQSRLVVRASTAPVRTGGAR